MKSLSPDSVTANLRRLRQAARLSQEKLAAAAGLSLNAYRELELARGAKHLSSLVRKAVGQEVITLSRGA